MEEEGPDPPVSATSSKRRRGACDIKSRPHRVSHKNYTTQESNAGEETPSLQLQHCPYCELCQSFVDVCLPTLESNSIPVLSRFLYVQASTRRKLDRLMLSCSCTRSSAVPCQSPHPVQMPRSPHLCHMSV